MLSKNMYGLIVDNFSIWVFKIKELNCLDHIKHKTNDVEII